MNQQTGLVVTSIAQPNRVLHSLAAGAQEYDVRFIVIGDGPSPSNFAIEGCDFYSLTRQRELGFETSAITPERHYARKNIGYLVAMSAGAELIVETDDDNMPRKEFWGPRERWQTVARAGGPGWVNLYRFFSDDRIWPRGLPLDAVQDRGPEYEALRIQRVDCPIQQGLADENPDVDAIYRLVLPLPVRFRNDRRVALGRGAWCPFNSQNTTWWKDAFPLLYLPAHCSFRMTDIWRSFVAQRIGWANDWSILFHEATVWQERNEHSLLRDFEDEIPGYLHNRKIAEILEATSVEPGEANIPDNLRVCYEALIRLGVIGSAESELLEAWLKDIAYVQKERWGSSAAVASRS